MSGSSLGSTTMCPDGMQSLLPKRVSEWKISGFSHAGRDFSSNSVRSALMGSLDNASAFVCSLPGLYAISWSISSRDSRQRII